MGVNFKHSSCNICGKNALTIFSRNILNKYPVKYFQCVNCGFIQTENPFWLSEAYNEAITNQDLGLISRNSNYSKITKVLLKVLNFDSNSIFLDYGGGYGMFVRQMRDYGFNFFRYDLHCQNIFAKNFEGDLSSNYKLVTAFEVFEHLENPVNTVLELLSLSDVIFFSTELQPEDSNKIQEWWYIMEETGQHISLFSNKSLEEMALKFNLFYYTNKKDLHIYSKKELNKVLIFLVMNKYSRKILDIFLRNRDSLLMKDYYNSK